MSEYLKEIDQKYIAYLYDPKHEMWSEDTVKNLVKDFPISDLNLEWMSKGNVKDLGNGWLATLRELS